MLLSVRATNWMSFYWFFICWSMPMMTYSKVSFLSNSYRDCELMSVTNAKISNICSLISMEISLDMSTLSKALIFCVMAGARVSSLSSINPRNNSTDPSTSSNLSSKIAILISFKIWLQSQPTLTNPLVVSTIFLEHSLSKPVLNMLTSNWNTEVPNMYFRFIGYMAKFLKMRVMVLMSYSYWSFLGG